MRVARYVRLSAQITPWVAMIIATVAEGILVWSLDQLPTWAQWLVYGPVGLALLLGLGLLVRDAIRARRRRRAAAEREQA